VLEKHKLAAQILQTVNDLLSAKGVMLKGGSVVDATLIAAPSSTKNSSGERDPEMKQSRKGQQWYFGMKCHIGVDIESGLVHTVRGTSGAVNDVTEANSLVRPSDREVYADAGYRGADKAGRQGRCELEHCHAPGQASHAGSDQTDRGPHRAAREGQGRHPGAG
jgi:IS5 family transposase